MSKDRLAQAIAQLEQRRKHYQDQLRQAEAAYQRAHEEANIGLAEIDQLLAILALKNPGAANTAAPAAAGSPLPRRRAAPGAIHDAILGKLSNRTFGPMSAADIATAAGLKPASVRAACKKLASEGKIVETVDGYTLPPAAKEEAARPATSHEATETAELAADPI